MKNRPLLLLTSGMVALQTASAGYAFLSGERLPRGLEDEDVFGTGARGFLEVAAHGRELALELLGELSVVLLATTIALSVCLFYVHRFALPAPQPLSPAQAWWLRPLKYCLFIVSGATFDWFLLGLLVIATFTWTNLTSGSAVDLLLVLAAPAVLLRSWVQLQLDLARLLAAGSEHPLSQQLTISRQTARRRYGLIALRTLLSLAKLGAPLLALELSSRPAAIAFAALALGPLVLCLRVAWLMLLAEQLPPAAQLRSAEHLKTAEQLAQRLSGDEQERLASPERDDEPDGPRPGPGASLV